MIKRYVVWTVLVGVASAATPGLAQDMRTPVILSGTSVRGPAADVPHQVGQLPVEISSSTAPWTEISFPDGTSIVLDRVADVVLRSVTRDPASGHWIIQATLRKGRLRIAASDDAEVQVTTGGATVRILAASAVVTSGSGGSATLLSSGEIEVQQNGRTEAIRRPSFSILFGDGGSQRQSNQQLATLIDSFAPVQSSAGTAANPSQQLDTPPTSGTTPVTYSTTPAPVTGESRPNNNVSGPSVQGPGTPTSPGPNNVGGPSVQGPGTPTSPGPNNIGGPSVQGPGIPTSPGPVNPVLPPANNIGGPPETPAVPHQPQSFALASAVVPSGLPSQGSTIAPPIAGSLSSTVESGGGFFSTPGTGTIDSAIVQVDRTPFGTARVRRFAPGTSGFDPSGTATTPRSDSGLITSAGTTQPFTGFFRNLAASPLGATPQDTFYDGITNLGVIQLTLAQHATTGPDGNENVFNVSTLTRVSITDRSDTPATQRPFLTLSPRQSDGSQVNYFGSAVFENDVTFPVHTNGRVQSLAGDPRTGLLVFVGDASSIPAQTGPQRFEITDFSSGLGQVINRTLNPPAPGLPVVTIDGQTQEPINTNTTPLAPGVSPPSVYIIDKIHAKDAPLTQTTEPDPRGILPGERYFIIGGTPIAPVPTAQGLPGAPPGTVTRFAISDGLDPQSFDGSGTLSIGDQFFLPATPAPGQPAQPVAFRQYNAFRPEETFVAGAPRGDTHLLVISSADGRNPALRTDFQIAASGRFSASASVGGISNFAGSLALSGAMVGSAQLDPTKGAVAITSNLGSLGTDATGLAAQMFSGSDKAPGQIGFFAVSQADSRQGAPGTSDGVQPGVVQAVGNPASSGQFAYTRLATNVGAPPALAPAGALNHDGFATGFVQSSANGQSSLYAVGSTALGDVHIASNASNTEFAATLAFQPTSVGDVAWDSAAAPAPNGVAGRKSVAFGNAPGGTPTTSVISTGTFAGVVPGKAAMASVDSDVIQGVANRTGAIVAPGTNQMVNADLPPSNEHLAWGFFLGDLANQAAGVQPDHVNLGFWVAGRPVSLQALQSLTGTATYAGGMVANVVQQVGQVVQVRSATGQFAEQWNFSNRTGSLNANFDDAQWAGVVASMPAGSQVFTGSGTSGNGRVLAVQGAFFHATPTIQTPATAFSAANTPSAVGGIFGIRGAGYGANGILVGGRR